MTGINTAGGLPSASGAQTCAAQHFGSAPGRARAMLAPLHWRGAPSTACEPSPNGCVRASSAARGAVAPSETPAVTPAEAPETPAVTPGALLVEPLVGSWWALVEPLVGPWWALVAPWLAVVARIHRTGLRGLACSAGPSRALPRGRARPPLHDDTQRAPAPSVLHAHAGRARGVRGLPPACPLQRAACPGGRLLPRVGRVGLRPTRRARLAESTRAARREYRKCSSVSVDVQCPGGARARILGGMRKPTRAARERTRRASPLPTGAHSRQPSSARRSGRAAARLLNHPRAAAPRRGRTPWGPEQQQHLDADGLCGAPSSRAPMRADSMGTRAAAEPRRGRTPGGLWLPVLDASGLQKAPGDRTPMRADSRRARAAAPRRGRTAHGAPAAEPRRGRIPRGPKAPKCQTCPLLPDLARCPKASDWCTLPSMNSPPHAVRGRTHRARVDSAGVRAPAPAARLQAR